MDRNTYSQLELFSESKDYSGIKPRTQRGSFFSYIGPYEKIIVRIIGVVIISIIAFSLGVQKGKGLAVVSAVKEDLIPAGAKSQKSAQQIKETRPAAEKQVVAEEADIKDFQQNFTIQLASYTTKSSAQKEAQLLKKKGFLPLILPKGKFIVLCVGKYPDRNKAKSMLSQFKKRYQDCLVRSM